MPQLDFSTFTPQLVWLAITFATLYFIITKLALPKIGGTIEKRSSKIANDLDRAQAMKEDVDKAIASYEAALADAKAKAHAIGQETRQKISAEIEAERQRVDAQIAKKVTEAEHEIAQTKAKAMSNVSKIANDIAATIVADLTGAKVAATKVAKAVEDAAGK